MKSLENPRAVERFRSLILHRLGLEFESAKLGFLGEVIQARLENLKCSAEDYLASLEYEAPVRELSCLAKELTVTETYFFRNIEQFRVLEEVVIPARMKAQAGSRTLRFLSAGCASGEEPYTIAMIAREAVLDPSWTISVQAVDINPVALAKARQGRYSAWAFRETPADFQRKWFRADGRDMILDGSVRNAVTFAEKNLSVDDPDLWRADTYDAVFCRNMSMYFSREHAHALIARIRRSLAPGGYLFLGHAETLRGISDDFHLRHTHGTFYYERKDGPIPASSGWDWAAQNSFSSDMPHAAPNTASPDEWIDTIHEASERVKVLIPSRSPGARSAPGASATHAMPPNSSRDAPRDMAVVLGLMRSEHFTEALAHVRELPARDGRDPDVLLLEAMLLAHNGETTASSEACHRLLEIDEMNAGAHYVLALCREGANDRAGAMEHDKIASYLDATFAMPRLHMGLLARRSGDRDLARRELRQAHTMLKHEDSARLLLFGGGFNRQALIALCESALRDCGG